MSKSKSLASTVGATVEDIEVGFYEALHAGDLDRLMACWADEDDVLCVHPGGGRWVGLGAIRAAFEQMFANGSVRIRPESVRRIDNLSCAVHSVRECVEVLTPEGPIKAFVLATNVYFKTAQGWRMVAHHASAGGDAEAQDVGEMPIVLH